MIRLIPTYHRVLGTKPEEMLLLVDPIQVTLKTKVTVTTAERIFPRLFLLPLLDH